MKCRHCPYEVGGYKPGFVRCEPAPAMMGHLRDVHPTEYRKVQAGLRRSREDASRDERALLGLPPEGRRPSPERYRDGWWGRRVDELAEVSA